MYTNNNILRSVFIHGLSFTLLRVLYSTYIYYCWHCHWHWQDWWWCDCGLLLSFCLHTQIWLWFHSDIWLWFHAEFWLWFHTDIWLWFHTDFWPNVINVYKFILFTMQLSISNSRELQIEVKVHPHTCLSNYCPELSSGTKDQSRQRRESKRPLAWDGRNEFGENIPRFVYNCIDLIDFDISMNRNPTRHLEQQNLSLAIEVFLVEDFHQHDQILGIDIPSNPRFWYSEESP